MAKPLKQPNYPPEEQELLKSLNKYILRCRQAGLRPDMTEAGLLDLITTGIERHHYYFKEETIK